jgi:hypothetical protein
MRQVFFKTTAALATTGGAGADRFSDLGSGVLGFWNLTGAATGGAWFGTDLFTPTLDDTAGLGDTTTTALATAVVKDFQIAQGFATNNPIATPIINARNLVSVTAAGYQASALHTVRVTPVSDDFNDNLTLRVVVRNTPTDYISYVNNEVTIADLSGAGYQFPLGQFNTTNHKLMNLAVSPGATVAAICDNISTAILNNNTFNSMFEVTIVGGAGAGTNVDINARHAGVIFDIIVVNEEDEVDTDQPVTQAWFPGVGNDWQARGDELKAREYAGNFNRMYFPQTYADFVTDDSEWDRYEVVYRIDGDRDVVKGSQFGSAIIYEQNGQNAVGAVLNASTADPTTTYTKYIF